VAELRKSTEKHCSGNDTMAGTRLVVNSHTVMRDPEGNEFCVELGPVGR